MDSKLGLYLIQEQPTSSYPRRKPMGAEDGKEQ